MKRFALASLFFTSVCLFRPGNLLAQTLPTAIPNLQLWLDASDPNANSSLPASGTTLASWKDKSGNSRNTVLNNSGSGWVSPAYFSNQINGKGVIRFTRTSRVIGSAYSAPMDIRAITNPEVTLFTVYKQGTQIEDQAVWGCDDGGFDRFFFSSRAAAPNNGSVSIGPVAPNLVDVTGAGQLGQVKCLTAVYSKAGGTNGSAIYFNGQLVQPFTDNTTTGTDALANVRIGLDGDDNFFNGDIAEMIIYNRKLTSCEIVQVNRYLNNKYGVSFSTVAVTAGGATTFNEGGSVTLSSTTTGTAYQWLLNGTAIPGAVSSSYVATSTGNYSLAVTNSCVDTSAAVSVVAAITAPPGSGLNFNGTNNYVDCGTTLAAPNIKTLECWAKFNSFTGDQELISKSKVGYGIEMLLYNSALSFFCMNGANVSYISYPVTNLSLNKWYHLAATWNGTDKTTMKLYVNGVAQGTRTDGGDINIGVADPGVGSHMYLGAWNDAGRYFNGTLDEVRVWNGMRTQAQVRANAYDTLPRNTAGLLAYYRFDRGIPGGTNTGITTLKDYSPSPLTSTLNNFALTGTASNFVESYALVAPMAQDATHIGGNTFTANWTAPVDGTVNNYVLDVSTNSGFTSYVSGYNGLNAGLATSYAVTGLSLSTQYYYRTRANKTSVTGQGADTYIVIPVITNSTLPVKWESFSVTMQGSAALIQWSTVKERNSGFFTIERSTDGLNFNPLSKVPATGNSDVKTQYSGFDPHPVPGLNYYRVAETDLDGNISYSIVKYLNISNDNADIHVFPSPATNYLFVDISDVSLVNTTITIYNLQAQALTQLKAQQGVQKISLSGFAPGMYIVRFANGKSVKFDKK